MPKGINHSNLYEAQKFINNLKEIMPVNAAILDNWCGLRIIYDTPAVENCPADCKNCRMYSILGEDYEEKGKDFLYTSLIKSSRAHTDILKYPMLNCKTIMDYAASFYQWILRRCTTAAEVKEELELITNFKFLFHKDALDPLALQEIEDDIKRNIIFFSALHGSSLVRTAIENHVIDNKLERFMVRPKIELFQ